MRFLAVLLVFLAGQAGAGTGSSCYGLSGPPISPGFFSAKTGESVAVVESDQWLHGVMVIRGQAIRFSGPSEGNQQANLPLESGRGFVTFCAIRSDLVAVVVIVDGGLYSGPTVYKRE